MASNAADQVVHDLTNTALNAAGFIPGGVGSTIQQYQGAATQQQQQPPATAPPAEYKGEIKTSGIPYLIEIVGPERAELGEKEAVLFGSFKYKAPMGIAIFVVLLGIVAALTWYLMKPEKKKRRRRTLKRKVA